MIFVAILKRTLKPGKTYEDFRLAWYHATGFGTDNTMLTVINAANPREVIVIALTEVSLNNAEELLATDAKERMESPLTDIIEPEVDRTFGLLIAEDDFSAEGALTYQPPKVHGELVDLEEIERFVAEGKSAMEYFNLED